MLLADIKEFNSQYDESLHLLRIEWAGERDMRRLRPALEQLQHLVERFHITHLLLGLENMPDISVYDQIWLGAQWMPRLLQAGLRQVVIVLSSVQVYNQHAIETILSGCKAFNRVDVQFFRKGATGMNWLLDDSPRLPSLLNEWEAAFAIPAPSVAKVQSKQRSWE